MDRQPNILVVDDEPKNVRILAGFLTNAGYAVTTAADGEEALRKVAEVPVDLVLLDLIMPGMNGFEATKRLRAAEPTRLIPIVHVTALASTEDRIKGIEAGCDDFISKPYEKSEILARVKSLLQLSYYRSLLDDKEKLEQVVDRIGDGILILDPSLHPTRVNQRAADLLSWDPRRADGDLVGHLTGSFTIRYAGDLRQDLPMKPLVFDVERPEQPTTKPLILAVRSSPLRDPVGNLSSIVVALRDVTEEREEQSLKQDFLSLISHKLRTPLAVILSNASLLQQDMIGPLSAQQRQLLDVINDQGNKLDSLVRNLLNFTSIQEQAVTLSAQPLILRDYLAERIPLMAKRLTKKPIVLRAACDDPQAATRMKREHVELIIENLIENAIKFNDNPTVEIAVTVKRLAAGVEVSVADNGRGIPPEAREQMFGQFVQVEKYFTGNVEGAGLGLALVKHLVTAAGGTIEFHSELGKGTTFTFALPG